MSRRIRSDCLHLRMGVGSSRSAEFIKFQLVVDRVRVMRMFLYARHSVVNKRSVDMVKDRRFLYGIIAGFMIGMFATSLYFYFQPREKTLPQDRSDWELILLKAMTPAQRLQMANYTFGPAYDSRWKSNNYVGQWIQAWSDVPGEPIVDMYVEWLGDTRDFKNGKLVVAYVRIFELREIVK